MVTDERITGLGEEVAALQDAKAAARPPPHLIGLIPPLAEINRLQVQVFNNLDLTANMRRGGRTNWSLKFEFWQGQNRRPAITIGMFPRDELLAMMRKKLAPDELIQTVGDMPASQLGGMLRRAAPGAGREYDWHQMAFLDGQAQQETVKVLLLIDHQVAKFGNFVPAKGTAVWFGSYRPK
jgi:hypothetical protein